MRSALVLIRLFTAKYGWSYADVIIGIFVVRPIYMKTARTP